MSCPTFPVYHAGSRIDLHATLLQYNPATKLDEPWNIVGTVTAGLIRLVNPPVLADAGVVTCTPSGPTGEVDVTWSSTATTGLPVGLYRVEFRAADGPWTHEGGIIEIRQALVLL